MKVTAVQLMYLPLNIYSLASKIKDFVRKLKLIMY